MYPHWNKEKNRNHLKCILFHYFDWKIWFGDIQCFFIKICSIFGQHVFQAKRWKDFLKHFWRFLPPFIFDDLFLSSSSSSTFDDFFLSSSSFHIWRFFSSSSSSSSKFDDFFHVRLQTNLSFAAQHKRTQESERVRMDLVGVGGILPLWPKTGITNNYYASLIS